MKYYFWTKKELNNPEEWDWVMRYLEASLPSSITFEDLLRKTIAVGKLLIANKLVIIYHRNNKLSSEIVSFKEYLSVLEHSGINYSQFSYHPINFKNLTKYKNFISKERDEVFSMLDLLS